VIQINDTDYFSITDLARYKDSEHTDDMVKNGVLVFAKRGDYLCLGVGFNIYYR
jgi:hypothetical protein